MLRIPVFSPNLNLLSVVLVKWQARDETSSLGSGSFHIADTQLFFKGEGSGVRGAAGTAARLWCMLRSALAPTATVVGMAAALTEMAGGDRAAPAPSLNPIGGTA